MRDEHDESEKTLQCGGPISTDDDVLRWRLMEHVMPPT